MWSCGPKNKLIITNRPTTTAEDQCSVLSTRGASFSRVPDTVYEWRPRSRTVPSSQDEAFVQLRYRDIGTVCEISGSVFSGSAGALVLEVRRLNRRDLFSLPSSQFYQGVDWLTHLSGSCGRPTLHLKAAQGTKLMEMNVKKR